MFIYNNLVTSKYFDHKKWNFDTMIKIQQQLGRHALSFLSGNLPKCSIAKVLYYMVYYIPSINYELCWLCHISYLQPGIDANCLNTMSTAVTIKTSGQPKCWLCSNCKRLTYSNRTITSILLSSVSASYQYSYCVAITILYR